MIIYMSIALDKEREIYPIPSTIEMTINGTEYFCQWDETDASIDDEDNRIYHYRFKGVSVWNENMDEEVYANGMLKDNPNPSCIFNELNWEEDDGPMFQEEILSLTLNDDGFMVECEGISQEKQEEYEKE